MITARDEAGPRRSRVPRRAVRGGAGPAADGPWDSSEAWDEWDEPLAGDGDRRPALRHRHPGLRWLAALVVVAGCVAGLSNVAAGALHTTSGLVITTPEALISLLQEPHVGGWSGRVTTDVDSGLHGMPGRALAAAVPAGSLVDGEHDLWFSYAGPRRQRIAVVKPLSEQDLVRNGRTLWLWDSSTGIAQRTTLASSDAPIPLQLNTAANYTPPTLTAALLAQVADYSTALLRSGPDILGRDTYQLVLRPSQPDARVGEVDIDVDGKQGVPLEVDVYAAGTAQPHSTLVFDSSFQSVYFGPPSARNFRFHPPAGSLVVDATPLGRLTIDAADAVPAGSGWNQVVSFGPDASRAALARRIAAAGRPASGSWGRGRVVQSALFSLLVTRSNRVVIGPVDPEALFRSLETTTATGGHGASRRPHAATGSARRARHRAAAATAGATAGSPRPR